MKRKELLRLADYIQKLPEKNFDMRMWAGGIDAFETVSGEDFNTPDCNTAGCIAGHFQFWKHPKRLLDSFGSVFTKNGKFLGSAFELTRKELKLTSEQASNLFLPGMWPMREGHPCFLEDPFDAAQRIRHFVHTNGKD